MRYADQARIVQEAKECTREIRVRRRLSAALIGTTILLTAVAPRTFAECMNWPLEADERPRAAFAFIATVTEVERRHLFEAGSGEFRYWITLQTERVCRGRVQDNVELTGTNSGAAFSMDRCWPRGRGCSLRRSD